MHSDPKPWMTRGSHAPFLTLIFCLSLLSSVGAHAQPTGDRLLIARSGELFALDLPKGDPEVISPVTGSPNALAFAPDGTLYAINVALMVDPMQTMLFDIDDAGLGGNFQVLDLGPTEYGTDLAFSPDGRLFLLTEGVTISTPPQIFRRLVELDRSTGDFVSDRQVDPSVAGIAPSDTGLWLISSEKLLHFDAANDLIEDPQIPLDFFGQLVVADTDSSGALWMITEPGLVTPPPYTLRRFDPATGSAIFRRGVFEPVGPMAIDRRCQPGTTARCLSGGRFRVTVSWRDFGNQTGSGKVAPAGSADSALFYFFDPSNWELMVKVIDGCAENERFWVFAAGTTNVEYTLEVTDLLTGAVFSRTNPLGQSSAATTVTNAFPGCP